MNIYSGIRRGSSCKCWSDLSHSVCVVYVPLLHDAPNQTWSHAEVSAHDHINTRTITEVVTHQAGKHSCSNEWPEGASTRNCWKALLTRKRNDKGGVFISLAGVKEQDLSYKIHENPRWKWQWSNKAFPTRWGGDWGDKHSWENGPRSSIKRLEESSKLQHPIPMSRYQLHPRLWNTWPTASHLVDGEVKGVKSLKYVFVLFSHEQNKNEIVCQFRASWLLPNAGTDEERKVPSWICHKSNESNSSLASLATVKLHVFNVGVFGGFCTRIRKA